MKRKYSSKKSKFTNKKNIFSTTIIAPIYRKTTSFCHKTWRLRCTQHEMDSVLNCISHSSAAQIIMAFFLPLYKLFFSLSLCITYLQNTSDWILYSFLLLYNSIIMIMIVNVNDLFFNFHILYTLPLFEIKCYCFYHFY